MLDFSRGPVAGVGAVVWKGDEILLVQRAHPPKTGSWTIPGGKQKPGETVFEATRREVREETSVEIDILDIATVVDLMESDAEGRLLYHYTVTDMSALWLSGEAIAGDDAAAVTWAGPERFAELGLTDDVIRVIALARLKRHLHEQGLPRTDEGAYTVP